MDVLNYFETIHRTCPLFAQCGIEPQHLAQSGHSKRAISVAKAELTAKNPSDSVNPKR